MIRLAVVTANTMAARAIEEMTRETDTFGLVYCGAPSPPQMAGRLLSAADPELILLDLGDWECVAELVAGLHNASRPAALLGFRAAWTSEQQRSFEHDGLVDLLKEPFSVAQLEAAAYHAVHRQRPVTNPNVLAFLPAKAGSGCSMVALNTAASLANTLNKPTLLVEADRRSGALSILLNAENRGGLAHVLSNSGALTGMEFQQHLAWVGKLHLLLANPSNPGPLPNWTNYYQLLRFVQTQYDFVLVDLPEVIDSATSELVKAARAVFIVCEPEVTSLELGTVRRAELEHCGVAVEKIWALGNRWEPDRLKREHLVRTVETPMFAALPNDYKSIKDAALESRLVARGSPFGRACADLARRLSGLGEAVPEARSSRLGDSILIWTRELKRLRKRKRGTGRDET